MADVFAIIEGSKGAANMRTMPMATITITLQCQTTESTIRMTHVFFVGFAVHSAVARSEVTGEAIDKFLAAGLRERGHAKVAQGKLKIKIAMQI